MTRNALVYRFCCGGFSERFKTEFKKRHGELPMRINEWDEGGFTYIEARTDPRVIALYDELGNDEAMTVDGLYASTMYKVPILEELIPYFTIEKDYSSPQESWTLDWSRAEADVLREVITATDEPAAVVARVKTKWDALQAARVAQKKLCGCA